MRRDSPVRGVRAARRATDGRGRGRRACLPVDTITARLHARGWSCGHTCAWTPRGMIWVADAHIGSDGGTAPETDAQVSLTDAIAARLRERGWSYGYTRALTARGLLWIADAHRGEHRCVAKATRWRRH